MGLLTVLRLRILISFCVLASAAATAVGPSEYEVKAVFLFNFSQFVQWPPEAFSTNDSALVIGVLGEDPFGAVLDDVVRGEMVHGRTLTVRRYQRIEDIDACHILFVSPTTQERLASILDGLNARSCLTVSDAQDFARAGGMIQFVTLDNRIRLQINLEAAKLANLTLSSKLLRPARIVTTTP